MASDGTRSLQDIRRDTERTREGLTSTVNELRSVVSDTATDIREKLRPETIKSEVSGYIRTRREELIQNLTESARRNPIQAVAVGASVAYPMLRIVRSIPLPVLMIGAGLFFTSTKKGRDLTQQASDAAMDFADQAREQARGLSAQVAQSASDAKAYARDTADQLKGSVDQIKGSVAGAMDQSRRAVGGAMGTVQDQVGATAARAHDVADTTGARASDLRGAAADAADRLKTGATQAARSMRETATSAIGAGQDYLNATGERLADVGSRASQTVQQTIHQNPLLVAGLGLVVGGLIASALPKLEIEDDLMGQASGKVRRRAYDAANSAFDHAKDTASDILGNVEQKAQQEGLAPGDLAKGVEDVGQRLQRVAERGITTAFEPEGASGLQSQTQGGGK